MSIIKILESTDFLRLQLDKLFELYGYKQTELLGGVLNNNVRYTFKDSDLVILDLDNYKIDVVSTIEEIKSYPDMKDIPIILLSSQSDIRTLKRAINAGCTEFVTKPFSNEILMQKVQKSLKNPHNVIVAHTQLHSTEYESATTLTWSSEYEIGIEEIDTEHKLIIDNYEKLYTHMKSGKGHEYYKEIVKFMEMYINEHFAHEEALQKRINYVSQSEHKGYHDEFKSKVQNIIDSHDEKQVTNMDLIKINLFLKDWILHHILVEDTKIGEFYKRQNNI